MLRHSSKSMNLDQAALTGVEDIPPPYAFIRPSYYVKVHEIFN